jgi:hypothetical protein
VRLCSCVRRGRTSSAMTRRRQSAEASAAGNGGDQVSLTMRPLRMRRGGELRQVSEPRPSLFGLGLSPPLPPRTRRRRRGVVRRVVSCILSHADERFGGAGHGPG